MASELADIVDNSDSRVPIDLQRKTPRRAPKR